MDEIQPGILHWTAFHEGIGSDVSSYYVVDAATLIDPMVPPPGSHRAGLAELAGAGRPERIVLTNRHHYRHSDRYVDTFGCTVSCHEAGLHEFAGGPAVEGFRFREEVGPGIMALEVDAICAEETALHIAVGDGILAFADGLVRWSGGLGFVPDELLGEEPEAVKQALREAYRGLLECDFDSLFFAHGSPIIGGGRRALEAFLAG